MTARTVVALASCAALAACAGPPAAGYRAESAATTSTSTTTEPSTTTTTATSLPPAPSTTAAPAPPMNPPSPVARPSASSGTGGTTSAQRADVGDRILGCESRGDPDAEPDWTAENPHSTASGAAQYLDSTWADYAGYHRAKDAPPVVQNERFRSDLATIGTGPWSSSRWCWA